MSASPETTVGLSSEERRELRTSPRLLTHAVLVGLTPLIPIPFVDDAVKSHLERRMTMDIARSYTIELSKEDASAIADGPGESIFRKLASGAVTLPIRLLFRKLFFVLEIKRASDAASECYHRGYLLELALAARALAPHGPRSPAQIREAIDGALIGAAASPAGAAVRAAFESSKDLVGGAGKALLSRLKKMRGSVTEDSVAEVVDGVSPKESAVQGIADRMKQSITEVPDSHFAELERRFEALLALPPKPADR
jgi:hypothetical protein